MTNPIAFPVPSYADAEDAIIAGLRSHHSRAAYHTVYRYFRGNLLSARAVQGYLEGLRQAGKSPATENLHLSAAARDPQFDGRLRDPMAIRQTVR